MADRRLRAPRREEGAEGRWRRRGRWPQAPQPARTLPPGRTLRGYGLPLPHRSPGLSLPITPGSKPESSPNQQRQSEGPGSFSLGSGWGRGRDIDPSSQFWKLWLYQVPNARPLKISTPNAGEIEILRFEQPKCKHRESLGAGRVWLGNGPASGVSACCGHTLRKRGLWPCLPLSRTQGQGREGLLLSALRGLHPVTDEMMDFKALVKCQLKTLHVRRRGYYYCCRCYY